MKRLLSKMDQASVGLYQSILEDSGIHTLVKNKNAPYKEAWPELWVMDNSQFEEAEALIDSLAAASDSPIDSWNCHECGEDVEKGFGECWKCGAMKPGLA